MDAGGPRAAWSSPAPRHKLNRKGVVSIEHRERKGRVDPAHLDARRARRGGHHPRRRDCSPPAPAAAATRTSDTQKGRLAGQPVGLADDSTVDAVIFDGGYGIDYVEFAASSVEKNHSGTKVKVSPSTQIAAVQPGSSVATRRT